MRLRLRLEGMFRHYAVLFAEVSKIFECKGFILRDAANWPLLTMRSKTLVVRSVATPRVSNHVATESA